MINNKQCWLLLLILCGALNATDYYVSPGGDDANPGTLEAPFKTIDAARDAVRRLECRHDVTVHLAAGRYQRKTPFELVEIDSGPMGQSIRYRGEEKGRVIMDGGRLITPDLCRPVTDPAILARLQKGAIARIRQIDLKALGITEYGRLGPRGFARNIEPAPLELFINGEPQAIARYPNAGEPHISMGKVIDRGSTPRTKDFSARGGIFEYQNPRVAKWAKASEWYISGFFCHGYAEDTIPVAKLDTKAGTLHTAYPHLYGFGGRHKGMYRWYALNLLEEIDVPGEFCVDRKTGILYFYAPDDLETAQIQVSVMADPMVVMENASNVHFENITFENARGSGAYIEGGHNNRFAGCTFRNLGLVAVQIGQGASTFPEGKHDGHGTAFNGRPTVPVSRKLGSISTHIYLNSAWNRRGGTQHGIVSCDIYNTGTGGIILGGGDRRTLTPAGNYVTNCDIRRVNRWDRTYKTPVNVDGVGNRITHNHLHDCPGQAILLRGNDHLIEYNHIHHVVKDMSDQGTIYMGRDPSEAGHMIRYNYFHDVTVGHKNSYGVQAIFFDDYATCSATVFGNVFVRTGSTGVIKFFRGGESPIVNNIFVDCPRPLEKQSCNPDGPRKFMSSGLGHRRVREAVDITGALWQKKYPQLHAIYTGQKKVGHPFKNNYVISNDMSDFVDAPKGNFKLKADAAVFKAMPDFKPIPFEKIGLYRDAYRR